MDKRRFQKGFTLLEITMVIVVIGLIVGGILFGRDLIRAAQIRMQIGQIEKLNTAVNTFKNKYQCLPGDCKEAVAFGLATAGGDGDSGDGDGVINTGVGDPVIYIGIDSWETRDVWYHLSKAGLIDGEITPPVFGVSAAPGSGSYPLPGVHSPSLKLTGIGQASGNSTFNPRGGIWLAANGLSSMINSTVTPRSGLVPIMPQKGELPHVWFLTISTYLPGVAGIFFAADTFSIDSKIDDGLPNTGTVRAPVPCIFYHGGRCDLAAMPCVVGDKYNMTSPTPTDQYHLCNLAIRASF